MILSGLEAPEMAYEGLETLPWPELPDGVRDLANRLSEVVDATRRHAGFPPSVVEEDSLLDSVTALVDRVIESPTRHGVQPMVQERLRMDEAFRQVVIEATRVRASRLWPLSRLLYLLPGLEEIHCFRSDRWMVTAGGRKSLLLNEGNPFGADEDVITFFRDRVLGLVGVVGATQLNDGAPVADTIGRLTRLYLSRSSSHTSANQDVTKPDQITSTVLDGLAVDLAGGGRTPATVATYMQDVKSFLRWLASEGDLERAPTAPRIAQPIRHPTVLTDTEYKQFVEVAEHQHPEMA